MGVDDRFNYYRCVMGAALDGLVRGEIDMERYRQIWKETVEEIENEMKGGTDQHDTL